MKSGQAPVTYNVSFCMYARKKVKIVQRNPIVYTDCMNFTPLLYKNCPQIGRQDNVSVESKKNPSPQRMVGAIMGAEVVFLLQVWFGDFS